VYTGWHQIAFEKDLVGQITPIYAEKYPLMLVQNNNEISLYDATCPHLGANLAFGGKLLGDSAIVCPFHGTAIQLGENNQPSHCVKKYPTININGLIFAFFGEEEEAFKGFNTFITKLSKKVTFIPGVKLEIPVEYTTVIENGFDANHFKPVHEILNNPKFEIEEKTKTFLKMSGDFEFPKTKWYKGIDELNIIKVPYYPHAFSPGIVCSLLGGPSPYWVITSALPGKEGLCKVWVSIGVYVDKIKGMPDPKTIEYMLDQMTRGLNKDLSIWKNLPSNRPFNPMPGDNGIIAFREFCSHYPIFSQ